MRDIFRIEKLIITLYGEPKIVIRNESQTYIAEIPFDSKIVLLLQGRKFIYVDAIVNYKSVLKIKQVLAPPIIDGKESETTWPSKLKPNSSTTAKAKKPSVS